MKPAWPNVTLSRWSKRLLKTLSLFLASFFLVTGVAWPGYSALKVTEQSFAPFPEVNLEGLLAQDPNTANNATLYFETPTFTVSVHPRNTQFLSMNVYNRDTRQSEQLGAPVIFRGSINRDGWVAYDSYGSRAGRNVIYRASANRAAFQARIEIIDAATDSVLLSQNSTRIVAFNIPGGDTGQDNILARTLVGFDTQNYSVRVFTDAGMTKMNVYNKASGQQVVNGQLATAEVPGMAPYECWVTYFGGQGFAGASARYFIRVSGDGQAMLEAIGANGAVLLSEPRVPTAPLVTNIPQTDRPACFGDSGTVSGGSLAPFIAAVFGGESELQQVRQVLTPTGGRGVGGLTCVINPQFENAPQGRFINAAECTDRNDAGAVVSFLRGRGLNSRLVYRNFRYR
jgi:hypothetical protein